jgi:precorrin-6B C5,15-methyltransferase / cobalt-precorrin-6B C5,C15-methyltransferase
MAPWLYVIGIGEDGVAGLAPAARTLLDAAEVLVGGKRHLAMIPEDGRERLAWPSPMSALLEKIPAMRGRRVAVIASGDPMWHGVGATLARRVPSKEIVVAPGRSAFSLAAARLTWPLEKVTTLSLHARPIEALSLHLHPGARLLILAHDGDTPGKVAAWLAGRGFGKSRMSALAHLGGPDEARVEATAAGWSAVVPNLHVLAVDCVAGPGARWWPRAAGLPDEAFAHDGQITKREVRALALARLMPHDGALLWDVGAGCGSVAVEWLRAAPRARVLALEPKPERRALIAQNATALGVPALEIMDARAPDSLAGLETPDAVFLGGGLSETAIAICRERLSPGGRLVAHAVTLDSEALLLDCYRRHGGDLTRLSVLRAEPLGARMAWRPAMPLTQWAWAKPWGEP